MINHSLTAPAIRFTMRTAALALAAFTAGCANHAGLHTRAVIGDANALAVERQFAELGMTQQAAAPPPGSAQSSPHSSPQSSTQSSALPFILSPAAWPASDWWAGFGDPQLGVLIEEALAGSPTVRSAAARLDRAVALVNIAAANFGLQAGARVDSTRQRLSQYGLVPPLYAGSWITQNSALVSLRYEFDFWDRNRAAWDSAMGQAKASEVDGHATRLLLSVGVAQAYVQLQRAHEQLDVARALLAQRQAVFDLTRKRLAAGLDSRIEVKQAESALPAARESMLQIEETIALTRNQLAALLGKGPDRGMTVSRPQLALAGPVALPSSLPADLLGRRPDLIAQRWRAEAARHEIAAATAQFYPNVNLAAFVGIQSLGFANLLNAGSIVAGAGPALRLPIFESGGLRGNLAAKNAEFDVAVEQYNQSLVEALREVVDQLASMRSVAAQRIELKTAFATASEAWELALARYRAGLGNFLQVLVAEAQLLAQKNFEAELRAREFALAINLIRALGGGYRDSPASDPARQSGADGPAQARNVN
ncbi:MAG: efflux transporter outer membrane subunit [Betaproteobacteria bacterium]|nr:efflux transporter outer membrane subunit [Betaproteobacteria bacterium]